MKAKIWLLRELSNTNGGYKKIVLQYGKHVCCPLPGYDNTDELAAGNAKHTFLTF